MAFITSELDQNPLVVVCGADNNYSMPLAVTLYSIVANLEQGCTLCLYIIDGGISDESKQRINRVLNVRHVNLHLKWISPQNFTSLSHIKTLGWVTQAAYLRLLTPEILPKEFNKAIYLDSDLLVKANLKELWDQEIGDYALLACTDFGIPCVSSNLGIINYKELGLAPDTPYFNSGVLVMNLQRWREENISQQVIEYFQKYEKDVQMGDQEGLNAVLANNWGRLNPKWNVITNILFYDQWDDSPLKEEIRPIKQELIEKPYILHFAGIIKPWKLEYEHPARPLWIKYLQASGWFQPAESIIWFSKWYLRYYPWQFKNIFREFIFSLGLRKLWDSLRDYLGRK
jgi:lipopolysaccharide biosynthesis glycosyltransferase